MNRFVLCSLLFVASSVSLSSVSLAEPTDKRKTTTPFRHAQPLFTNGQKGYVRYRIPSLLVTRQGTVLAFAEARKKTGRDWDDIDLAMRRSKDGGKTWSEIEFIMDQGQLTIGNPCPVVDQSNGTIWMLFSRGSKPGRGNAHVLVMHSKDDGKSWSKPKDITSSAKDSAWPFVGTGPGHGIQLRSGRLLIPCWADNTPRIGEVQFSFCLYSDDHGASWKYGERLTLNASDECDVVELENGGIYLNARSRQQKRRRAWAISKDGGRRWSEVQYHAKQPEPSCDGSVIRWTDSKRFMKSRILVSCPGNPKARDHLTFHLTYDECKSWSIRKVADPGFSGYSDLAVSRDQTALCLYETRKGLKLMRFNIEWLTDGNDHVERRKSP